MARRAKMNYMPKDLIYSGYPYVVAVKTGSCRCEYCCKLSLDLKRCKKCRFARYCGKKCQAGAWPDHKLECRFLKKFPECNDPLLVRLISLLIFKMKNKKWEDIYENVEGEKVSFADMWCNSKEVTKNPKSLLHLKEINAALNEYIDPEKLPNQERMYEIIDKVRCNAICLEKSNEDLEALGLYLGIGNTHPSCIPNARMLCPDTNSRKIELRSIAEIRKNEKITMCLSSSIITFRPEKRNFTIDECKCEDCLKPYGESVLTKILDDSLAYSVIMQTEDLLRKAKLFSGIKNSPAFVKQVDDVLEQQEGVLGKTNFLRLRLLALKVIHLEVNTFDKILATVQLLDNATEAFGNHHIEVRLLRLVLHKLEGQLYENCACRIS